MPTHRFGSHPTRRITVWIAIFVLALLLLGNFLLSRLLGLGNPIVVAPDAACAFIEAPNQHAYRFFHEVDIDRFGMRSAPFAPEPAPGTLRIMFVGDSITYGTTRVGQSDIFTQILRRNLPAIVHQPVEVLNASASAWAPSNELDYVRSRGIFHSDLVLLVLNDGDISQPRAVITGGLSQDTTYHHSTTALGEIWTRFLMPRIFHHAARKDAGDASNMSAGATISANLVKLNQFRKLVAADHARFALVYLPFREDIPDPAAQAETILRQWTSAHNVPMFDLTRAEDSQPSSSIILRGEAPHFNVRGNLLVAHGIERQWHPVLGTN